MNLKLTGLSFCLLISQSLISQTTISEASVPTKTYACGTETPPQEWDTWFNAKVQEFNSSQSTAKTQMLSLTIPVIVHVIHGGQATGTFPNITATQIKSQITTLNKDFSGTGFNVNQLASNGFSLVGAANCNVSFCLAQNDPNGTPLAEPGIERINYINKGWTNPTTFTSNATLKNYVDATIKPGCIWDPTQYFNIWVTDVNTSTNVNLLGYATFPSGTGLNGISSSMGTATTDGIWVWAKTFGSTGTLLSGYERGRTATHEVGHWLGLRHIGGDASSPLGDCNATDYCEDTPSQTGGYSGGSNGQNFGYPPDQWNANVCGSIYGDMFMNFMDYTYDAVKYMFTPDQAGRIQTAMANGYFRSNLNASSANLCTGLPAADFALDSVVCLDSEIDILDLSSASAASTYSWSLKPEDGSIFTPSNTSQSPKITYTNSGTYTITVLVSNSVGISYASYEQRVMDCTGMKTEQGKISGLKVFPNPSEGLLYIHSDLKNGQEMKVTVCNALGQVIVSGNYIQTGTEDTSIDLTAFPEGVYALSVMIDGKKEIQRILITR